MNGTPMAKRSKPSRKVCETEGRWMKHLKQSYTRLNSDVFIKHQTLQLTGENNEHTHEPTYVHPKRWWCGVSDPVLPSLTTRAFAQEGLATSVGRNFLAICSDHGDIWGANQYPEDGLLTQTMRYAGRDVRYGQLPTQAGMNGRVTWSAIYTADAQQLTPQLASKFNVLKARYSLSNRAPQWWTFGEFLKC